MKSCEHHFSNFVGGYDGFRPDGDGGDGLSMSIATPVFAAGDGRNTYYAPHQNQVLNDDWGEVPLGDDIMRRTTLTSPITSISHCDASQCMLWTKKTVASNTNDSNYVSMVFLPRLNLVRQNDVKTANFSPSTMETGASFPGREFYRVQENPYVPVPTYEGGNMKPRRHLSAFYGTQPSSLSRTNTDDPFFYPQSSKTKARDPQDDYFTGAYGCVTLEGTLLSPPSSNGLPLPSYHQQIVPGPDPIAETVVMAKENGNRTSLDRPIPILPRSEKKRSICELMSFTKETSDEAEKKARREKNRVQAKQSRLRKKSLSVTLEDTLEVLKEENSKMKLLLHKKIGSVTTTKLLQHQQHDLQNSFIQALKHPENCILDGETANFLQHLRKKLLTTNPSLLGAHDASPSTRSLSS
mmetsp:Transcript_10941/g.19643  ORF Transcript_10941/g.19643 Transcript_10941/m.19643 type:complete len:410 (+) Transcript_10941:40-1269(+)